MDRLDDLEAFVAVVEKGGQTAAARHLRRSLQSVNRSLMALERGVGAELIRRTTRQSNPTEAGLAFYRRIKPAVAEIRDAQVDAARRQREPAGLLRIGAPVLFAPAYVVPAACDFMRLYPQVEIALQVSDREVDLVAEHLDIAVRIRNMRDSTLQTRRLGALRVVAFGAPDYFAVHGRPEHPDDLSRHNCVVRLTNGDAETWPFRVDGKRKNVRVSGSFRSDGTAAANEAAARGAGIGFAPLWQIRDLVERGVVEVVLAAFELARIPIHAVWPPTRAPLAKARLFADFLAARLKREDL